MPGVEITHVPKEDIALIAREARYVGAKVVNVHGETVTEPVEARHQPVGGEVQGHRRPGPSRPDNRGGGPG